MHFSLTPTERMSNHARVYALRADGDEFAEVARVKRDGHTFWLIVDSDLTSEAWKAAKALGDARTFSGLTEIKAWLRALNWHHSSDEAADAAERHEAHASAPTDDDPNPWEVSRV